MDKSGGHEEGEEGEREEDQVVMRIRKNVDKV